MKTVSDVIIVGGGPSGSFTALNLAKLGASVTVFEEHSEIGVPCHCAGHLSISGLKRLGLYPLPKQIVENVFYGANFYSPKGSSFSVRFASPITYSVNRALFDKFVAEKAEKAGAKYRLNSQVDAVIVENGFVNGVTVRQFEEKQKFSAKLVIDAEGVASKLLRQIGLRALSGYRIVNGVQAEVEGVENVEPDMVEVFLGKAYAPGLYAWLIPKSDGNAKVGLAAKEGNPKMLLQRFMLKHPVASKKLQKARLVRTAFHPIPLGGPIPKVCSNGFLAVGDVASQVKPTTGGGVIFGLTCAKIAAETAYEALENSDCSSEFLMSYQKRCEEILGFDVKAMLRVRNMLDKMSDEKVDTFISFCKRSGLEKALCKISDIDFQGQAILRALRYPRLSTALIYLFFLNLLRDF